MLQSSIRFAAASIDSKAGFIAGVSVITEGEARGHTFWMGGEEIPVFIDEKTVQQVKTAADAFGAGGVKVKIDHYSGFQGIVGNLTNFRIESRQLRADLSLLKEHEMFDRIIEMAETMPKSFGLSIAFSGTPDVIDKKAFARCTELYSVDLVDLPAANPGGLFSAKPIDSRKPPEVMSTTTLSEPGLIERFTAFLNGKANQQLEADLATARQSLTSLADQVKELEAKQAASATKITELETRNQKLETDLKSATDAKTDFEKKMTEEVQKLGAQKASEICAALNVKPLDIKPDGTANGTKDGEALITELKALQQDPQKGIEATEFYRKHRAAIDAAYRTRK